MKRRSLLALTAASALARPAIAQPSRVLRFVPQGNLNNPDPVWTTTTIARNHGLMIWDTLYAVTDRLEPRPQMVEGHEILDDGRRWRFTLRDGLAFHEGEPVRAADCVASIQRWAKRRGLGQRMMAQTDEMRALDDRRFEIRMSKPYPLLPYALSDWCFVMPERVARTSAFEQIADYTGSGPYRFVRDEWVAGSQAVYARNDRYVPRQEPPDGAAGGKVVNFDRVVWQVVPDPATAAAALQAGEVDWVEQPLFDLLPSLRASRGVRVLQNDSVGAICMVAFNHLHPPFNNPRLLRALLPAVDQQVFMEAAYGQETGLFRTGVGVFTPGLPMANTAGLEVLTGPRDPALAKRLVAESGYKGERVRANVAVRLPGPAGVLPGDARLDGAAWHDRGLCQHRLGHAGAASHQPRAAGAGRVGHVLHDLRGHDGRQPGQPPPAARQRRGGVVRLADQPAVGSVARPVVRRAGRERATCRLRGHAVDRV